jgi:hypothetical protein
VADCVEGGGIGAHDGFYDNVQRRDKWKPHV